ncbi:MAG: transposase [Planctomycetota bacterium]|nr:transposase [Planctomycetota bacterium]
MSDQPVFQTFDPAADVEITYRDLPHWFQPGVAIFVTFRTFDSMPQSALDLWEREQLDWLARQGITVSAKELRDAGARFIERLPEALRTPFQKVRDRGWHERLDMGHGECLLRNPVVAEMVAESIEKFDANRYDLDCFIVMPNHVHVLLQCRPGWTLRRVANTWLDFTARRINKSLGRSGHFWQSEPFDHLVRSVEQFDYLRRYIRDNPKKAGLKPGELLYRSKSGPPGSGGKGS